MRVKNNTIWSTSDIKKILCEALRRNSKVEGELDVRQKRNLTVEISYSKQGYYSGYAYYNGTYMKLKLPGPTRADVLDEAQVAWLFVHELYHIRGYHHNQMGKSLMRYVGNKDAQKEYRWADDEKFKIHKAADKKKEEKPRPDLQLKRFNHAAAMLKRNETKLKRTKTQVKKWKEKVRYYERVLTAAGKI